MDMPTAIDNAIAGKNFSREEMRQVMLLIMTGKSTDAQTGGFLVALRMKGETVNEILGAAEVMRDLATSVEVSKENLVDTCGTGGSGSGKFNVSTASAIVAAAAGARVAKHGNRAASSQVGSADLLEAAGVKLDLTPEQVARCIESVGVGFLFAVNYHTAMKYAIGPRKEMAVRTIFNLLGPLTNPAGAPNHRQRGDGPQGAAREPHDHCLEDPRVSRPRPARAFRGAPARARPGRGIQPRGPAPV